MAKTLEYPSRTGAPGTINGFTLDGGFTPASTHFLLTHPATSYSLATDRFHYYVGAFEAKAGANASNIGGQPRSRLAQKLRRRSIIAAQERISRTEK